MILLGILKLLDWTAGALTNGDLNHPIELFLNRSISPCLSIVVFSLLLNSVLGSGVLKHVRTLIKSSFLKNPSLQLYVPPLAVFFFSGQRRKQLGHLTRNLTKFKDQAPVLKVKVSKQFIPSYRATCNC